MNNTEKKIIILLWVLLITTIFWVNAFKAESAVMTSTNFKLTSDSINFGGSLSTSTNYKIEDTIGEIATGESSSASYKIKAGYQQMQEVYLAITAAADVTMSPSIGGVTGGTSNGSTNVTVTTDGPAGYSLSIKASSSPALQSDQGTFANYLPAGGANIPDFTFSVAALASELAYTPEGVDITSTFKDNGSACNTGSTDTTDACWAGFRALAQTTISQRSTPNHPSGTLTTIKFRAESGSSHLQPEGQYTATSTLTLVSL